MALISDENAEYRGPETFSEAEKQTANQSGVLLKDVNSKTASETYLANICPHCGEFIGKWYFFTDYYVPAITGQLECIEVE